jgi:Fe-S-cluster containining protein
MRVPRGDSELVQIVDAALADAATSAGDWLVCRPGCTQCCHGAFAINALDALRLADGMDALCAEDPERAARVEERTNAWIETFENDFPGDLETGFLDDSPEGRSRFVGFANEAPCPALDPETGLCDVYESRPMTCRVFGPPVYIDGSIEDADVLGHCELCFIGATTDEIATCEMAVPHDVEDELLAELPEQGETVVAFALRREQRH